jgi:hypothetical protein
VGCTVNNSSSSSSSSAMAAVAGVPAPAFMLMGLL